MSLTYLLAILTAYSGLIAGIVLGIKVREEVVPGKGLLRVLEKAIVLLFLLSIAGYVSLPFFLLIIILIFILMTFDIRPAIVYGVSGLALFVFRTNNDIFFILTSLVFIYGLAAGSIMTAEKKSFAITDYLKMAAEGLPLIAFALVQLLL